jgi:hypothetical protein
MSLYKISIIALFIYASALSASETRPSPWSQTHNKFFFDYKTHTSSILPFSEHQKRITYLTWHHTQSLQDTAQTHAYCEHVLHSLKRIVKHCITKHAHGLTAPINLLHELKELSITGKSTSLSGYLFFYFLEHEYRKTSPIPYLFENSEFNLYSSALQNILIYIQGLLENKDLPLIKASTTPLLETCATTQLWEKIFARIKQSFHKAIPITDLHETWEEKNYIQFYGTTIIPQLIATWFPTKDDAALKKYYANIMIFIKFIHAIQDTE